MANHSRLQPFARTSLRTFEHKSLPRFRTHPPNTQTGVLLFLAAGNIHPLIPTAWGAHGCVEGDECGLTNAIRRGVAELAWGKGLSAEAI